MSFLKTLILVFLFNFVSHNTYANTFIQFDFQIRFIDQITLSVSDFSIDNVVGGDTIDVNITMFASKDPDRSATCSVAPLILTSPGEADITSITSSVNGSCTLLFLDGVIPTDAATSKTYSDTIDVTYAYDVITII